MGGWKGWRLGEGEGEVPGGGGEHQGPWCVHPPASSHVALWLSCGAVGTMSLS